MVVTADCDLLKDHVARRVGEPNPADLLPNVLFCECWTEQTVVFPAKFGGKETRVVNRNQNERFHCFPAAPIRTTEVELPALYLVACTG